MISVTTYALVVVPAVCIGLGLAGYAWTRLSAERLDRARAATEARPPGPAGLEARVRRLSPARRNAKAASRLSKAAL